MLSVLVWYHFVLRCKREHFESKTWKEPLPHGLAVILPVLQKYWKNLLIESAVQGLGFRVQDSVCRRVWCASHTHCPASITHIKRILFMYICMK